MKLSIIIPMYNAEKTIIGCIDSIEIQETDFEYEIIIIDDGSTDSSIKIVKRIIKKYNNIVLLCQKNLKQSVARNNGLNYAKGKYVMFFDCDDDINQGMLRNMINLIDDNNDLVMCGINKVFSDKVIVENKTLLNLAQNKKNLIINYLTRNKEFDVGLWNKVFKLDVIKDNDLHFENGNFFEDSLFVLKYLCAIRFEKIQFVDDTYYNLYKRDGMSTTMHFNAKIDYFATLYEKKVKIFLDEMSIHLPKKAYIAFKIRTRLHLVHHHINYDSRWNTSAQKKLMTFVNFKMFFNSLVFLDDNYKVASIAARYFPLLYIRMYKNRSV